MPRANRHFLPDLVWHITHRCHEREFLLRFHQDRKRWRRWLYEARKRYGLCILDYIVTSNHVHLLVRDRGQGEIPRSMQLIAGRTGQAFNHRKGRKGAFWEDRYHATAVQTGDHLARCLTYIDLNMVRAGAVVHPGEWEFGGYREIQSPPARYRIIDLQALMHALEIDSMDELRRQHRIRVEDSLAAGTQERDDRWTRSLAVGSQPFVQEVQRKMGLDAQARTITVDSGDACLREPAAAYRVHFAEEKWPSRPLRDAK